MKFPQPFLEQFPEKEEVFPQPELLLPPALSSVEGLAISSFKKP